MTVSGCVLGLMYALVAIYLVGLPLLALGEAVFSRWQREFFEYVRQRRDTAAKRNGFLIHDEYPLMTEGKSNS
ncbi:MAG: hypothetical protein JO316_25585 [Abitibacteriaceae bacterium]|nr:hypothetical protein [Abditibacteriaceae bacterium]